jgi:hypothetical protein
MSSSWSDVACTLHSSVPGLLKQYGHSMAAQNWMTGEISISPMIEFHLRSTLGSLSHDVQGALMSDDTFD